MELWKINEANEQALQPDAREHEPVTMVRSPRRLTERAIVALLRSWLLNDYMPAYGAVLASSRIFRRCYWIDALGMLDSRQQPPASLQTLNKLAQNLADAPRPITIHAFLLAGGSSQRSTRTAQKETPPLSVPKQSSVLNTNWLTSAPTLLQAVEQSPAVFLINPLAPTLFTQENLAALYKRSMPGEYCLLLQHKQIEQCLQSAGKRPEQGTILTTLLRSDRWKSLDATSAEGIKGFLTLFAGATQRHFKWSPQQINLSTQSGPASIAPLPTTLLFATRRSDSLLSMNDALCRYQRRILRESYRGVLSEEWFVQQEEGRRVDALNDLAARLRQQGETLRLRRWPELRQQSILNAFGQFTQEEYDTCIQSLIAQQQVRCVWRQAPSTSQQSAPETRIPGNEDTLLWR